MVIHNSVIDEIQRQLENYLAQEPNALTCKCQQCMNDVVALAANRLPARYTASEEGRLLAGFELQNKQAQLDIFKAILEATRKVNSSPRHSERKITS